MAFSFNHRALAASIGCLLVAQPASGRAAATKPAAPAQRCRVAIFEGEAQAGEPFERPLGNSLKILLEPIASGWILRVLPANGPRGQHDYAELATPPYQSVSPLLIGTDFSFRAQDALAWNPRHFHFAPDQATFAELSAAYVQSHALAKPGPPAGEPSRLSALRLAESRLALLASQTPEAELTILDAHLVQGVADQAQTAAMVASHLSNSAHQVDQPPDARPTPLGRLNWLQFRIRLNLPTGFHADHSLPVERSGCP